MGGEIGAFAAPSPPDPDAGLMPLLPGGTSVFDDLPARAIVIGPLAPAIGDGLVVVRNNGSGTGLFLVRDGEVVETHCLEADGRLTGDAAARKIKSWKEATVSARRMGAAVVAVVPPLILGDPAFSDLRLDWIKWNELVADVRSQSGTYVIEVITPSGRGVTCIRDGEHLVTYTEAHPDPGHPGLLDEVATAGTGIVRVLRDSDDDTAKDIEPLAEAVPSEPESEASDEQPAAAPPREDAVPEAAAQVLEQGNGHTELFGTPYEYRSAPPLVELDASAPEAANGAALVATVLPDLKLLVRDRLHKSSTRLEIMLEEAATWDRTVESVADEVRQTSIRGVAQSTLEEIADEMLAVGGGRHSKV